MGEARERRGSVEGRGRRALHFSPIVRVEYPAVEDGEEDGAEAEGGAEGSGAAVNRQPTGLSTRALLGGKQEGAQAGSSRQLLTDRLATPSSQSHLSSRGPAPPFTKPLTLVWRHVLEPVNALDNLRDIPLCWPLNVRPVMAHEDGP